MLGSARGVAVNLVVSKLGAGSPEHRSIGRGGIPILRGWYGTDLVDGEVRSGALTQAYTTIPA